MKKIFVLAISILISSIPGVAFAGIFNVTGNATETFPPPPDLLPGSDTNDPTIAGIYRESTCLTVPEGGVPVDVYVPDIPGFPAQYGEFADFVFGTVPEGTQVDSYVIHMDSLSEGDVPNDFTIEFDVPIVGASSDSFSLDLSDDPLANLFPGPPGNGYPTGNPTRGLDLGFDTPGQDRFTIENDHSVRVVGVTGVEGGIDQFRLITLAQAEGCVESPSCGNGVIEAGETCDDGNTNNGDGCDNACMLEEGFECTGEPSICVESPSCGNGVIEAGETCDDGNTNNGDGCDNACMLEEGFECTGEPSVCTPVDNTPPETPNVITPTNGQSFTNGDLTVSGTAEALSDVTIFVDNQDDASKNQQKTVKADADGNWSADFWLDNGSWEISTIATDSSGNSSTASDPVGVTVDNPDGLKIKGDAKQDFLDLLAKCTKQKLKFAPDGTTVISEGNMDGVHSASLRALKDKILNSDKMVEVDAKSGPEKDILIDAFQNPVGDSINGPVDMDDINSLPDDVEVDRDADGTADSFAAEGTWVDGDDADDIPDMPNPNPPNGVLPHAETPCAALAHILGERSHAIENGADFEESHDTPNPGEGGQGAGNKVKSERPLDKDNNVSAEETTATGAAHDGHTDVIVEYDDGSSEVWHQSGANGEIELIEYFTEEGVYIWIESTFGNEGDVGNTEFKFTVNRVGDLSGTSTVDFKTADGTGGVAGTDYQAKQGTLTFGPGESMKTISINVIGDTDPEPFDTFFVNLSNCNGCKITDASGQGTIVNDDGKAFISIESTFGNEGDVGNTEFKFTVNRVGDLSGTSTVDFKTADGTGGVAGTDYQAKQGTLTFGPGVATQTISINVIGDTDPEPFDTFFVNLSNCNGCTITDGSGQGTIVDDDS